MTTLDIIHGDSRFALQMLPSNSIDSIVTDPPYALVSISKRFGAPDAAPAKGGVYNRSARGFMGQKWDTGDTAFDPAFWFEALRVVKPGAHVLAFGGTRTYHRLACAIEDAGFEIRDQIGWLYGSGFPKSHNQTGEWEGWGTALKPAWEPIVVARKPLDGTVAGNLATWRVGALNIDGCRIEAETNRPWRQPSAGNGVSLSGSVDNSLRKQIEDRSALGRWPANIIHDGSAEVLDAFPTAPGQIAKASSSSESRKTQNVYGAMKRGSDGSEPRDMGGSAARFFKSCEWSDEEWLRQFLHLINANTAVRISSPRSVLDAFAQSDAATLALPAGTRLSVSTELSTSATPTELRKLLSVVTAAMQSFGVAYLPELQQEKLILLDGPVTVVARRTQIDTMTITIDRWRSDGFADPATLIITLPNTALGGPDSRFSYCAKASRADREDGLDDTFAKQALNWSAGDKNPGSFQSEGTDRTAKNNHPTVKPTELMRYLCRLVTPPGGVVLDPFMGSGSTGRGAVLEGFGFVGVEMDERYTAIARARIAAVQKIGAFG